MSPHAANSLVHDLVQMAQAMEQLPQVREELAHAVNQLDGAHEHIQRLELKLIDRKVEADELHAQIKQLEVARDDAELRFLEADDRTEKALAFVRTTFGNAGALIQALDPKPSSEPEPKPVWHGDLPKDVAGAAVRVEPDPQAHTPPADPNAEIIKAAEGQSEPGPTASETTTPSETASLDTVQASDVPMPSAGPYSGKRYYDHSFYVSLVGWLAGGGTQEDYEWRPASQMIG